MVRDWNVCRPQTGASFRLNIAVLIAAFLLLSAWLTQNDEMEGAGRFLTAAALYVWVYWRLIGKLDK